MTGTVRRQTFFHALAFVLGFTLVFTALGASVAFIGYALRGAMPAIAKIGGAVLILFGLQVSGLLGWISDRLRARGWDRAIPGRAYVAFENGLARLLYTDSRVQARANPRWGYFSSVLMGIFFVAGWIPCISTVLSAILALASTTQTVGQGALLLLAYSAGLGIPFLVVGAAFSSVTVWLRRVNRRLGLVSKITGVLLVAVGVLLLLDKFQWLNIQLQGWLNQDLAGIELGMGGPAAAVTIPIAFLAGLLSFLSPCVLPLVPVYLGYLGGTAVANGAQRQGAES